MSTIALIPARGGSTRVLRKNLQPIGGDTLVGRKIKQLLPVMDEVYVGSEDAAILDEARRCGAVAIRRGGLACDETRCNAKDMIADFVARVKPHPDDIIVWAHCTNPFVYPAQYDDGVHNFSHAESQGRDSLFTTQQVQRHMWVRGQPFNFNPLAPSHVVASELEPVYFQDGAMFIQRASSFINNSYFYGPKAVLMSMPYLCSFDIDTPDELMAAQCLQPLMDQTYGYKPAR